MCRLSVVILVAAIVAGFPGATGARAGDQTPAGDTVIRLTYRADLSGTPPAERAQAIEQTSRVILGRLERFGLGLVEIANAGPDFRVTVPGGARDKVRDIKDQVGKVGTLTFHLVAEASPSDATTKEWTDKEAEYRAKLQDWVARNPQGGKDKPTKPDKIVRVQYKKDPQTSAFVVDPASKKPVVAQQFLLHNTSEYVVEGSRIRKAYPFIDPQTQTPAISFELTPEGAKEFARLTKANLKGNLAVVLDDVVQSAPTIQSEIAGPGQITGNFTLAEGGGLANILSVGSLPVKLALLAEEGPLPVLKAPVAVFVFRHGEAYGNLPDAGKYPVEKLDTLTDKGVAQAKAAAGRLVGLVGRKCSAIIHSPAVRAKQTAALLEDQAHAEGGLIESPALASMRDGKTPDGKPATFSWRMKQWASGEDPTPAGGESLGDAVRRTVAQIEAVAAEHPGTAIVVVSHSDICAGLAAYVLGTPMCKAYATHHLGNAESFTLGISRTRAWSVGF